MVPLYLCVFYILMSQSLVYTNVELVYIPWPLVYNLVWIRVLKNNSKIHAIFFNFSGFFVISRKYPAVISCGFCIWNEIPVPTRRLFIHKSQNPDTRTSLVWSKKSNTSPTLVYTTTVLKKEIRLKNGKKWRKKKKRRSNDTHPTVDEKVDFRSYVHWSPGD
jgi:hypothetical protein